MAEISTEDATREEEEEEEPASEHRGDREVKEGEEEQEGETTGNAGQTSSQSGSSSEASISQMNMESDSDTEEEEEEVTKSSSTSNSSTHSNQTTPKIETVVAQPPPSASCTSLSPSASPAGGQSVISSITVMESAVPPGTPPSPGRCISVSSPGRGHKIFMVTRVESPPEQQQQQQLLQINAPASPSQTKESSKKPVDATTQPALQQTQTTPASQTPTQTLLTLKESVPAPSTDCKLTEQSPVAHLKSTLDTTHIHTLEPQAISQPPEDETPSALDPDVTHPSLLLPDLPSDPSPVQVVVSQPTEEATESTKDPQSEQRVDEEKEGEKDKGCIADDRQLMSPDSAEEELDKLSQSQPSIPAVVTQQQPITCALEQLQNEIAYASEEFLSPNQIDEDKEELLSEETHEAPQTGKPSLTEEEDSRPNQQEPSPKQQTQADEQGVGAVLSAQTDQQAPSVIPNPASTGPEATVEVNTDSPVEEEESADESSADEDECFAEALDGAVVGSALPNGLKPEFSLHLLDAENPKPGSCVMEHGESH